MDQNELLFKLYTIVAELEQRQALIEQWVVNEDPELVLLGQYQQEIVNRQHLLLKDLIAEIQRVELKAV